MPVLRLELQPGRSPEQKRDFAREVTRVAVETLKCKAESVDVVIVEIPPCFFYSCYRERLCFNCMQK